MTDGCTPQAGDELASATDAGLLACMATGGEGDLRARSAWEEFYRRHVEYLYRVCLRAYGDLLGGEAGAADITAEALRIAFVNADKFDPAGIDDAERLRLRARGWLGWIARRLVQDILRSRRRLPVRDMELGHWPAAALPGAGEPTEKAQLARQAIEALSEREQVVIRTTMQWYRPEKDNQRLPNEVSAELAATLATTPENLRQIRRRAMTKIAEFIRRGGETNGKTNG